MNTSTPESDAPIAERAAAAQTYRASLQRLEKAALRIRYGGSVDELVAAAAELVAAPAELAGAEEPSAAVAAMPKAA